MAYSNSKLVSYTRISPNRTQNRNHVIDTITIHCVAGQCSVETLGEIFAPASRQASANYGIGPDGRIGMYCEEKDRSWCSSSGANDHRAVTIEVASDKTAPYAVNDKAYAALIELVTDICQRNGIKKLLWKGDKSLIGQVDKQNMTMHKWFANTDCPGAYLEGKFADIANKVNAKLNPVNCSAYVQTFQIWLKKVYGYNVTPDGACGPVTKKAAIKAMQTELNKLGEKLAVDGGCGKLTRAAMTRHIVKRGTKGNMAYIVQGLLYGAGYDCNGFDGSVGAGCDASIRKYQADKGIEVDGKVGGETLYKLTR